MPEQPQPNSPSRAEVEASLEEVSRLLGEAHHLGPEAQETLAGLVEELSRALDTGTMTAAELAHVRESTAHLAEALRQHQDEGLLARAVERLEEAVVGVESRAPVVAGVVRRLIDALANLGI
jgi:hypothetical protein